MNKTKKIYFMLMFISVFLVSTMCFSYAFFTSKTEGSGKLNIVVGTLDYKLKSKALINNKVTVGANSIKQLTIEITSLNDIDSKYELYYLANSDKVEVGYDKNTNIPSGEIESHKSKKVYLTIVNNDSSNQTITFGVEGGLINNDFILSKGNSISESKIYAENLLNGSYPVLTDNLLPVNIDDKGTVTKADLSNEWYDYETKKWANAVVLKDNVDQNKIYDLSGNGNDATIYGATITEEGLSFDGIDDYAKIDMLNWNNTSQFTIEFTAKVYNNSLGMIFESSDNSNGHYGSFYIDTNEYGTNDLTLAMKFPGKASSNHKYSNNILVNTSFKTYTMTFNSNKQYNDFIDIYVDGVKQQVAVPNSFISLTADCNGLTLGDYVFYIASRGGNQIFTQMVLKNLRIYTKELSQTEIQNNLLGKIIKNNLIVMYELGYEKEEVIPEDAIESYFVWIPKYSYQLWDLGNYNSLTTIDSTKPHAIPIKFGLTNTSDSKTGECKTPGLAGESGNCEIGDYMTHPAFLAFDTNGFWVGKFETGFDGADAFTTTEMNTYDKDKIIIKPNVYSWRNNTLGNMFKASFDYLRSDESHMIKNTEWGAVAYLQHSKYGSSTNVRINNNSAYITGYAAVVEPTKGYNDNNSIEENRIESTVLGVDGEYTLNYFNPTSVVSSTTGNYTGIYDMNGGAWEHVMGYTTVSANGLGSLSGIINLYDKFFTDPSYDKYYDKYIASERTDYNNRILGDTTGEMGSFNNIPYNNNQSSWYNDMSNFAYSLCSWFVRSAYWSDGVNAGIFAFSCSNGQTNSTISFRIVLSPTK